MGTKDVNRQPEKLKPINLANSLEGLDLLVSREDTLKNFRDVHKVPTLVAKVKVAINKNLDDQEKCYIYCKRLVYMIEFMFKFHNDQNYVSLMFGYDYDHTKERIRNLRTDLRKRYAELQSSYVEPTTTEPAPTLFVPLPESLVPNKDLEDQKSGKLFKTDTFIKPVELFDVLIRGLRILIVDLRPPPEFEECRIITDVAVLINISADLIVPGLSANTLGERLDKPVQTIWAVRDTFEAIVLMDDHTLKYDYSGSKLRHLRNILLEWDCNRTYKQEPVVLNGGIKEYIDWYPTEVLNYASYQLSKYNSEVEEILDIDEISYPTSGTQPTKIQTKNSLENLLYQFQKDAPAPILGAGNILGSRSEGNVPQNENQPQENIVPLESVSEPNLPLDEFVTTDEEVEIKRLKLSDDENNEIRDAIEGERANLLQEARAVKPKQDTPRPESTVGDHSHDAIVPSQERPADNVTAGGEIQTPSTSRPIILSGARDPFLKKPGIDRKLKPTHELGVPGPSVGDGYTAVVNTNNVCYMITILQCMKVVPILKKIYVDTDMFITHTMRKPPVMNYSFATVMRELWKGTKGSVRLYYFTREWMELMATLNPVYALNNHEDAFEFFLFLFSHLNDDCSYEVPKPDDVMTDSQKAWVTHCDGRMSILIELFYHQLRNVRVCRKCNKASISFEMESTLMVPVPDRECTLEEVIKEYLEDQPITDFVCTTCKTIGSLVHRKEIVSTPDVLVIVLKRYKVDENNVCLDKNNALLKFPKNILYFGGCKYKLYAVPQHLGTTQSGHYFASILLGGEKETWMTFNDHRVYPANLYGEDTRRHCCGFFYVKQKICDKR